MFSVPFKFKCSACGREPSVTGWSLCTLCAGFFCADHLVVKKGVATCESCAVERERLEASSEVSAEDEDRVVALICADVEATIGPRYDEPIVEAAARHRLLYAGDHVGYVDEVVDDVQQHVHDLLLTPHGRRVLIIRTIPCGSHTGGGAVKASTSQSPDSVRYLA